MNKTIIIHEQVKPIRFEYSDNDTYFGDTAVTIYDDFKISLVLTDDCGAVIGDKIFFPQRGDIIIFRPEDIHFGRFPRSSSYKFISCFIPVDLFDRVCPASKSILSPFLDDSDDRLNLIRLSEPYKIKLIELAEELLSVIKEAPDIHSHDVIAFAKLIEVLDICNQCYPIQKDISYSPALPPLITKAIQKINEQFPDFCGLDDLAQHCGCSVTYLTQTFRKYTGKSIHNYLTQRRLEQARRLLQRGVSVTEAGYQSGFYDSSAFISQFKKQFLITPGKYKKCSLHGYK